MCTWQCGTLKCSATHPAFSPVRNISRLLYFIFLLCQNQFQSRHSRRKWRPLTAWTVGRRISQLTAGQSTLRSGACFETFLQLRFQSSLWQVGDENSEENEKKKRPTHPVPVSPLDLSSPHSGKHHRESFFCDYLNVWILWLSGSDFNFCFHLESCSVKVCLNWRRKVNWTFWYQIWVGRGWLWKKLPPRARSAWMPVQTRVLHSTLQYSLHYSLHYSTSIIHGVGNIKICIHNLPKVPVWFLLYAAVFLANYLLHCGRHHEIWQVLCQLLFPPTNTHPFLFLLISERTAAPPGDDGRLQRLLQRSK